jgi:S-DNA-T family DNA segregation ATPase FtsK/SpoIIIE
MLEKRNLQRDLLALSLLALAVFLALALFTYDPADPPGSLVHPPRIHVSNACGRIGAVVADLLFHALGLGAYYVLLSLGVLVGALLRPSEIEDRWLRTVGWFLSLAGVTTLFAMALPQFSPGPVIGAGGYWGAAGRGLLLMHFANAGAYVLVSSLILVGWLLSTDYVLVHLTTWFVRVPVVGVARGVVKAGGAMVRSKSKTATGEAKEQSDDEDTVSIRIGGRVVSDVEKVDLDEEDEEEDDEEDEEVEEKAVEVAKPGASKVGVAAPEKPAVVEPAAPNEVRIKKPVKRDERTQVMQELDAAVSHTDEPGDYELPSIELLMANEPFEREAQEKEVRRKAKILEKTFANFGFNVKVVEIETGPVIAQFEVELEAGLRLSKITSLADDLAIALRVPSVRIVAPIPGKNTVGIEIPNEERQLVRLREVIEEADGKAKKMRIPIYLGKDVAGNPMVADLASLPHLLIAGRTGTGKSVCLNTIIVSMLMTRRPDEVRMLLIDPKMVELSPYKTLPHLMHPVVTDMRKAEAILAWAVEKMEERYALLARAGVRHISGYNQLGEEELMERLQPENDEERKNIPNNLPYIVIVADEMADLMMTAAKEVETHIIRLAQKSRAVGIHLVLATQKPTVDVITGLIKSNLPARIAFQVASRTDSRVVLDEMGADKLLGNGDMLFLWPGTSTLIRGQGTYVSDEEITKIVECVGTTEPEFVKELVQLKAAPSGEEGAGGSQFKSRDELYEAAVDIVIREGRGSVSLLQRALGIGYGRGARLIDFMAEDGIVGQYNGSQAREVLITLEQWAEMCGHTAEAAPPAKRSSNKVLPDPPDEEEDEVAEDDEELAEDDEEVAEDDEEEEAAEAEDEDEEEASAFDGDEEDEETEDDEEDEEEDELDDESEDDEVDDDEEPEEVNPPKRKYRRSG